MPDDLLIMLGDRIRTSRKRRGWTQVARAEKVGLDLSFIADAERGKRNISILNLDFIAACASLRLSPAPAGRRMLSRGERISPARTHFPSGERALADPSPRRTAGAPSNSGFIMGKSMADNSILSWHLIGSQQSPPRLPSLQATAASIVI